MQEGSSPDLLRMGMALAKKLAARKARKVPRQTVLAIDFTSVCYEELISIFKKFTIPEGFSGNVEDRFNRFATPCLLNAMTDAMRANDHLTSGDRSLSKKISAIDKKLRMQGSGQPSSEDISRELGVSLDAYHKALAKINAHSTNLVPFEETVDTRTPEEACAQRELVVRALACVTEKQRRVLMLYSTGLTYQQIAEETGTTQPNVFKMYQKGLERMREVLSIDVNAGRTNK